MNKSFGKSDRQREELEAFYLQTSDAIKLFADDFATYQASSNAKYYQLEIAQSLLEKAKSVPLKPINVSQISRAAVYLQRSQTMATLNILKADMLITLGLSDFKAGKHLENDNSWVSSLWVAKILPSFHPPGMLAVVNIDKQMIGAFGGNVFEFGLKISQVKTALLDNKADKVGFMLNKFNLLETEGASQWLDGIGYEIEVMTLANGVKIEFDNPRTNSLANLEKGLLNTAKAILDDSNDERIKDYLTVWQSYVHDSPAVNNVST